jgi:hypothetical protein
VAAFPLLHAGNCGDTIAPSGTQIAGPQFTSLTSRKFVMKQYLIIAAVALVAVAVVMRVPKAKAALVGA